MKRLPAATDPLNEATEVAADLPAAAASAMQTVKEKVVGMAQAASETVSAALPFGSAIEELPHERDADLGHAYVPRKAHEEHHAELDSGVYHEERKNRPPLGAPNGGGGGTTEGPQHGQHHGPLGRMKEAAAHAVEGVKMRLHLGGGHEPTAEERTGEPMHMAKAAEGRNKKEDDPVDHALHDALRPEKGERAEVSAFPETLGDAVAVAQLKDLPHDPASFAASALSGSGESGGGEEPAPPNPFTSGARARL